MVVYGRASQNFVDFITYLYTSLAASLTHKQKHTYTPNKQKQILIKYTIRIRSALQTIIAIDALSVVEKVPIARLSRVARIGGRRMVAAAHQPRIVRSASLLRLAAESQWMAQANRRCRCHIASVAQSSLPRLLGVRRPDTFRTAGKQVRVVLVFGTQLLIECVLWDHCGVHLEAGIATAGVERLMNVETLVRG